MTSPPDANATGNVAWLESPCCNPDFVGTAQTHHGCGSCRLSHRMSTRIPRREGARSGVKVTGGVSPARGTMLGVDEAGVDVSRVSKSRPHRCRCVAGNEIRCSGEDYLYSARAAQCVGAAEWQSPSISSSCAVVGKDAGSLTHTCNDGTGAAHWWTDLRCRLLITLSVALERGSWVSLFST